MIYSNNIINFIFINETYIHFYVSKNNQFTNIYTFFFNLKITELSIITF